MTFGWRVYGLGIIALGVVCLAFGNFDVSQPVPKTFPDRIVLAYGAAVFMLVAGLAIESRRTAAWGALALAIYFVLVVVVLMNGRLWLANYASYGIYESLAEQFAIVSGAAIVYAANANLDPVAARRITRAAQIMFGICAIIFGGAHFVYMNLTAPLVPKWLPPGQMFWAYATGGAHIAAGLAIISGIRARLAAILLTIMYASFTPLVHIPLLLSGHLDQFEWSENVLNVLLTGVAWVVADSFQIYTAATSYPQPG